MSSRKISPALFFIIMLCFFLPFLTFACYPEKPPMPPPETVTGAEHTEKVPASKEPTASKEPNVHWEVLSGFQTILLAGGTIKNISDPDNKERFYAIVNLLPPLSFLLALTGLVLSLREKTKRATLANISTTGAVTLMIWYFVIVSDDVKAKYGFFIILTLFITTALLNTYYAKTEKKEEGTDHDDAFSDPSKNL